MTDELALGMSELAALLLNGDDVADSLGAAADIVARMLPDQPEVGITLTRESGTVHGASSSARAMLVEESRRDTAEDPSQQAISTAQQVSVPDMANEHRWGGYATRMLACGIRSLHAQPLTVSGETVGALSLYSPRPRGFTERARLAVTMTAEHIGVLLAVAIDTAQQAAVTDQLRATLASRSTIDQALGILMAEHRCSREAAFRILREKSQRHNTRVATLAAEIIQAVSGGKPTPLRFIEPAKRSPRGWL
ncbi:GAF and ANTAR domain-containing protein [Nocardia sp. NPDC049149]|uniref:GAF and ANTAR domain-containing protein n=1 Tax=Nocardia sp. NPDC049149 TaxID=3364315 RepID=UPI00371C99B6